MQTIIHVIPYDTIGGVELAAASAEGVTNGEIRIQRLFVVQSGNGSPSLMTRYNPFIFWRAAGRLKQAEPTIILLSLWPSILLNYLAKLRGCHAPTILFLHNSRNLHFFDRWMTELAARKAIDIFADSRTTLENRLASPRGVKGKIISFQVARRRAVHRLNAAPSPNFIYWGRLVDQKNPLRALSFFNQIHSIYPQAKFTIIGPDGGLKNELQNEISRLGLASSVSMYGKMDRAEIEEHASKATFYLQTSKYEGMSLSVVEAMQYGLIPVVTPVGEINNYSRNGENAIWISSKGPNQEESISRIRKLLEYPNQWEYMRDNAIKCWLDKPLYSESLLAELVKITKLINGATVNE
jgi:glycosyltransferase involved in cell wall biosynthesis